MATGNNRYPTVMEAGTVDPAEGHQIFVPADLNETTSGLLDALSRAQGGPVRLGSAAHEVYGAAVEVAGEAAGTSPEMLLLTVALKTIKGQHRTIGELEEKVRLLHYDSVTCIFNRNGFTDGYRRWLDDRQQEDTPALQALVLYSDLDNLKVLNDSEGHAVGDEYLAAFAKKLSNVLQGYDAQAIVGRFGGDEFMGLITGNFTPEQLDAINGQLSIFEYGTEPSKRDGEASVGIAIGTVEDLLKDCNVPPDSDNHPALGALQDEADRDMYLKKHAKKLRQNKFRNLVSRLLYWATS